MSEKNLVQAIGIGCLMLCLIAFLSIGASSPKTELSLLPESTEKVEDDSIKDDSINEVLPLFDKINVEISVEESIDEMPNFIVESNRTAILVDGWVSSLDYDKVISNFETLYNEQALSLEDVPLFLVYGSNAIQISSFVELKPKNLPKIADNYAEIPNFYTICDTMNIEQFDRIIVWTSFTYDLLHLDRWETYSDKKSPFYATEIVIYETNTTDFNSVYEDALWLEGNSPYKMIEDCQEKAYKLCGANLFYRYVKC